MFCAQTWKMGDRAMLLLVLCVGLAAAQPKMTVVEKLRQDSDLSQFLAMLEQNEAANASLYHRQMTLFAPTNEAFQKLGSGPQLEDSLVFYHMSNLATSLQNLEYSVSSELEGNPPLWVTRRQNPTHDDIYINNARVITLRSYQAPNSRGKKQVLHVIDQVLIPVQPLSTESDNYNPNAYQFLEHSDDFSIGQHRLRSFRQKVNQLHKKEAFQAEGRHTFFIPVEDGFKPSTRPDLIDAKVIDGHIIPNHVLFTQATPEDRAYETLAFGDNVKVTASFSITTNGKEVITYVKSNTVVGDVKHSRGVVMADIVRANIPVKNGVVHLIQRPLMVVDTTVSQFLEGIDREEGPLFRFYEVMMDLGGKFFTDLAQMKDITLFAPSNEAWKDPSLANIIRNQHKLNEILSLHLVRERLSLDAIMQNNMHQIFQVPTAANRKYLYFNVMTRGNNQTLTVEGGGVNATVIQPNIAATNGFVHIIDRVLGVPYTTVYDKLRTDPMLNITYHLGRPKIFNHQLNDMEHRFTYFVPRDLAWQKFQTKHPSAFKKLFMDEFSYYTKQILERHLIRDARAHSISDMKLMANETHPLLLQSLRDPLRLHVKESDKNYYVQWNGHWIHVFRPDVECINGIIHVIDEPFLLESDIRATGGANKLTSDFVTLPILLLTALWAKIIEY